MMPELPVCRITFNHTFNRTNLNRSQLRQCRHWHDGQDMRGRWQEDLEGLEARLVTFSNEIALVRKPLASTLNLKLSKLQHRSHGYFTQVQLCKHLALINA